MSRCDIQVTFNKGERIFAVGEEVSGVINIKANKSTVCHAVHIVWQWRTHGRGNTAKGMANEVIEYVSGNELDEGKEYNFPFTFPAPNGPLTYRGHYLNIDWYLSARVDARGPFDPKGEEEFLLLPTIGKEVSLGPAYSTKLNSKVMGGCGLIFSSIFLVVGLIWIIISLLTDTPFFVTLFGAPFFVIGLFLVYRDLRNSLALNKLGNIEVTLDERHFVPGEVLNCQVIFTPKTALDLKHVVCKIHGKEQVIRGSGTDKTTYTHNLYEQEETKLEDARFSAGEKVEIKIEFTIPEDAAYTFAAVDNKLFWEVTVTIDVKGWPNWVQSYPITVQSWKQVGA